MDFSQSSFPSAALCVCVCVYVCVCVCVRARACMLSLFSPVDCSPPSSSVQGVSQARILEWVAMSFSRGSSRPRDWTGISCTAGGFFTAESPGKPPVAFYILPNSKVLKCLTSEKYAFNFHLNLLGGSVLLLIISLHALTVNSWCFKPKFKSPLLCE